jgi:PAS domain S-box-containing protein
VNAKSQDEELDRFKRHVTHMTEVLALGSLWHAHSADHILGALGDTLLRMLHLSFVHALINPSAGLEACEVWRADGERAGRLRPGELKDALAPWIAGEHSPSAGAAEDPFGGGRVAVASLHFGSPTPFGTLVTAASRADYPDELEMLLLQVAVRQASVALEEQTCLRFQRNALADIEARVANRTRQLTEANSELRGLQDGLAAELGAMADLHEFSTRVPLTSELQPVLEQTLVAIMRLQNADFGKVQLHDPERGGLVIVAHRNFPLEFLEHFAFVRSDDCASGRAVQRRERIIIEDVECDEAFAPHRAVAAATGFRAVQSTPLISHSGGLLGMLSTHFRKAHRPSDFELRLTDLYARYATQTLERKRAEDERSKLASIVENSADFIGIASLAGQALFLNAAGRKMIGLHDGEPVLDSIQSYLTPEDGERLRAQIMPTVERVGFWDGETSLRHIRTGAVIPVLQHVFFIHEPQTGRRLALATVCRDITERRRAEHAASNAQQELARASRLLSLGELTISIAHEINQPLAAIVTNGDASLRWVEREVPDLEEASASLKRIIRDANRAGEVIRRIHAFATKGTLIRSSLNVNDVIREVLTLTQNEMVREEVVLHTELADSLTAVMVDRIELQQVVLNLVINGIEAMRPVTERTRVLSITSTQPDAASVEVFVRDNGHGVEPQHLPRLFEVFFTTKSRGMGLGLSISRRIIEAHGGRLCARPNPDCGLTLCFSLPAGGRAT